MSGDSIFASLIERELGPDFEVHSAATDIAALVLLDSYAYACVVVDLSAEAAAGNANGSSLRLSAVTAPVVALVPAGTETALPEHVVVVVSDVDAIPRLAKTVRNISRRVSS